MEPLVEEHPMPAVEAMLAGTLALMTGYSQFLQAAENPAHRLSMGEKIAHNLGLLAGHPMLSPDCRCVLAMLRERWTVMSSCTAEAATACTARGEAVPGHDPRLSCPAPATLQ